MPDITRSVMPDPIRHPVLASTGLRIKSAMTVGEAMTAGDAMTAGEAMTNANNRYIGNSSLP